MGWFKNLFKRKVLVGYRVINDPKGKKEDMGVYRCSADEALEKAQMKKMQEHFRSNSPEAMILNFVAEPVYEVPEK
jgi:hypothetical protein